MKRKRNKIQSSKWNKETNKQTKNLFSLLLLQSYVMQLSSSVYLTYSCSALVFFQWCLLGGKGKKELKTSFFLTPLPTRCKMNGCKTSNLQLSFSHWHDKVCSSHAPPYECVSAFTLCSALCPVGQAGISMHFSSHTNSSYTHMCQQNPSSARSCVPAHLHGHLVCAPQL